MNNLNTQTAYVGSAEITQVRKGDRLVLAPNGNKLWYDSNELPSLDLRFAEDKSLVDATTGSNLVDFTRASSGTYVGSDGLIKTSPVNELLYSNEFTNAAWTKSDLTLVSSTETAPDGTATATTFLANNNAYIYQDTSSVIGQPYVSSIWIKGNANATLGLRRPGMTDKTIGSNGSKAINVTTEWQKFTAVTTSADDTDGRLLIDFRASNGASVPSGFEVSLWHAQTEEGTTATDYIPTTSTISGAPRFDHDPATGESLGLLVEESRTNLVAYSEAFNQWTQTNVDLNPDQVVAPNGTLTADEMLSTSGITGTHRVANAYTFSNAGDKTVSVYVKNKDAETIRINLYNSTDGNVAFAAIDLSDFSVSSGSATVSPVGNGWHRISLSGSYSAVYSQLFIQLVKGGGNNFTGDGTGVYLWGAQLEEGSFPTSYIPTTGSTVTRAADVASISGSNFSGWYNQSKGTVFSDVGTLSSASGRCYVFSNGTVNQRIGNTATDGNTFALFFRRYGVSTSLATNTTTSPARIKYGLAYQSGNSRGVIDGVLKGSSINSVPIGIDQLSIGSQNFSSDGYLNGHIKRLAYFNTRLPDATLQNITS